MNKRIKITLFIFLVLTLAISLFGCSNGKKKDEEIEKLFNIERITHGYAIEGYKGTSKEVTIPTEYKGYKIKRIARGAFAEKEFIEKVNIPSSIEEINSDAFARCINLKEVTFREGIKRIEDGAFNRTGLTTISFPKSLEEIGSNAFHMCKELKTVSLNEGLKSISSNAFSSSAIETVTMPSTLKNISNSAFARCTNLKSVSLNQGLQNIGSWAFAGTSISEITISKSVKSIGANAFGFCNNLTAINCEFSETYTKENIDSFEGLFDTDDKYLYEDWKLNERVQFKKIA